MKDKLNSLPSSPGIYLMKDYHGGVIYVGKSKNLKQRVQSYFYKSKSHSNKVKRMVSQIKDLEYRVTDTEFEAFMLECKLIHEIKPVYNKKMKNPLGYTYILIHAGKGLRSIEVTNVLPANETPVCFGPYTANRNTVEKAVQGIRDCFKIACNQSGFSGSPCLNHSLGLCLGMCAGGEAEVKEYNEILDRIISLLDGTDRGLYTEMVKRIQDAAERFDFEAAAKYRDQLDTVNYLLNKEKVIGFTEENRNIVITEKLDDNTVKLFLVKRNRVLISKKFNLQVHPSPEVLIKEQTELILSCFREDPETAAACSGDITRDEIDEAQIIYSYLQGSSCNYFHLPQEWIDSQDTAGIEEALINL